MGRIQSVRENWTEITEHLRSDKQELAQFLRFSAGIYKQSFPDTALIYHQNPNATKVAELKTWNKLGRLVNKGESSIAVFGANDTCRHYFDVSQTHGKREPALWNMQEDLSAELTAVINQKYGKQCKNIQESIAAMSVDNIKPRLADIQHNTEVMKLSEKEIKAYQQSVVSAVRFVVSSRCELNGEMKISGGINLSAVDNFKDNRDLIRFCDLVQKSAKDTLLEMERELVQIMKIRKEREYGLQNQSDRTETRSNPVHNGQERTGAVDNANRQMGQTVAGMDGNGVSDGNRSPDNGGTLAVDTERNRQGGTEPLGRTGYDIPSEKSSPDEFRGNSDMGENKTANARTSSDGGSSFSPERITVESLIDRYNHADFNRRWDSYEIAGWILSDAKATEYRLDAIAYFNKFDAEKYPMTQADEIRNLMKTALDNRTLEQFEVSTDEIGNTIDEPTESALVIENNEIVKPSEKPAVMENNEYTAKIKRFFEHEEKICAELLHGGKFVTAGVSRDSDTAAHIDVDGETYRLSKLQVQDLEHFEIFRAPITHDFNGFYADDLQEDDVIRLEDEYWTVVSAKDYSLRLVNNNQQEKTFFGKWQEQITLTGFEYIPEEKREREIDKPIFVETVKKQDIEPLSQGEQLTLFGDPVPLGSLDKKPKTKKVVNLPAYEISQDMIDYALKCGSNNPYSLERIVAQFQKGKSSSENAEFLQKEFGTDGRGYKYVNAENNYTCLVSAWFDKDGITLGAGNTAFNDNSSVHLTWEQAGERISTLLGKGMYTSQDNIDRAVGNELKDISEKLWYLHQDCEVDYFIPDEMFSGGFPDSTARIAAAMTDKETLQKYIDGLSDFCKQYEENRDVLRFHFHKPQDLLGRLKDLQFERKEYITKSEFSFDPKYFITEDEKDKLMISGSGVQDGKFRISEYFKQDHTAKEKADFLKHEYGDGGSGRIGYNTWHDASGLKYQKGISLSSPDCEVFMKWNEAAERVERLIAEDKYITQKDIDERIRHAQYTLKNYSADNLVDKYHVEYAQNVLAEYGIEPQKENPVERLIAKAVAAGIPVEMLDEQPKEIAVYMDTRDESFILLQQVDEGIDYSVYAHDLSLVDGGVWEMDEGMDLLEAASELLATERNSFIEIKDFYRFVNIADMNTDLDVPAELEKLKNEAVGITAPIKAIEKPKEQPVVNVPEAVVVPAKNEPKSGTPVTYHFNKGDIVQGGAKTKYKANIEAIQTLQKIEVENRYATPEEQSVMAKYVGWGGIPQAFASDRAAENIGGNLTGDIQTGWETEQQQLKELLSPDEYKAARASMLTSFYTPPEVTDGVYQALSQFGFEGGNVLEPSMGVGNFFAKMPEDIQSNSKLYGVELDSVSGRIAKQLYPESRIQIKGFEQTNFNNNSFDVVVGNIPFGDYRVSDKTYNKHNFKIHDYFAAKTVDKVKPGGVVALVTSKFTMDKQNEKARRYLAERCDLLGAVRLPNNAFKQSAGTEVTSDILFLKKRETMTVEVPDWVHMSQTEDGIPCNKYFIDNPDMVLGKMAWDERMKGKYGDDSRVTTCVADDSVPLAEQIKASVAKIEGNIETVKLDEKDRENIKMLPADPSVRNFTHTIINDELYFRENEVMTKVHETGKNLDRMMGMHKIRQAAMAVINAQADGCTDEELKKLQSELNTVYDKFKKAYGNITDKTNERCFQQDDDYNTLAALEIVDSEKKTVEKAEIFTKRTIQPEVEITSVDTPQEALQVSVDRLGVVNIPYMAKLAQKEPDELIKNLGSQIFRNPAKIHENEPYSGYEDASEYLSGNVREKLRIAHEYAKHIDSSFERNAVALEKVIPKNLEASEISVRIGANWVDAPDYNKFLHDFAKADTGFYGHPVTRTKMGEYKIEGKYQDKSVAANQTYGTSRMSSYHIFENLLNQRDVIIRDRKEVDGKVYYEINAKETQLAKEKARQIKDGFKEWIWKDIDRREKYVERYNNLFNAIRGREYDGSHQTFPGMNPSIKLRPHQENAILRGKLGGNELLAHAVGAGKSFEMVATTMEKKRLGLIGKGCVVVPKHLTLQMASEWMRLYPNAKLLVARPEDFEKNNRQKFIARCVTGDYDAVIMSFTQFERIPMSDEYRKQFMERELNEIMSALEEVDNDDRVSVKALEREKMRLEERLEKLTSGAKDNSLCFEKLGFDYLVCDEAHNYKNCFVATKMSNVAGVQTTAAQKSEDMLMKTQYLNDKFDCSNILFATGTPVSNSMVELYVMQRYLRPDLLRKAGVVNFDDWASTFGEVVSQLEMKPAGDGYRMKNRFSKFVNIPELMQMYKEFADIRTADMLKLDVPDLKTGKPIIVSAKPDGRQKAYMKELAARSEAIHNGNVDPSVDNMLKITHEARLLGLDSRCIFQSAEPTSDSKVSKLLDNLELNYHETAEQKGVQIVFCDIAINEDSEHFSVYKAIKADLVKRGIPREEICFAGDAKTDKARAEMFEQLRSGEKRFIIASTSKLGTGANVQDKICAIHHLDIPWKPSDLTQQDGRGVRQGNNFDEIGIYHYLTEETFDAYMMGIITNKAKFINQIMTSKDPVRVSEDVDEMVLTYSEMQAIATGNPLIKEKISLDNDIANLKMLEGEHKKDLFKMQELAERKLPQTIENYADLLEKASKDLKAYQEQHPDNADFRIEIGGKAFDERADAGEEIEKAIIKCSTTSESVKLGKYFGFDISIEKNPANSSFFEMGTPCIAVLQGNLKYTSEVSLGNNVGNVRRIENLAGIQINQKIQQFSASLDKAKTDLEEAKANVSKPFERAIELDEKLKRIAVVNAELSKNSSNDEPIPVSDTPSQEVPIDTVSKVMITMPTPAMSMANTDRMNAILQREAPLSPQLDKVENQYKPKHKSR